MSAGSTEQAFREASQSVRDASARVFSEARGLDEAAHRAARVGSAAYDFNLPEFQRNAVKVIGDIEGVFSTSLGQWGKKIEEGDRSLKKLESVLQRLPHTERALKVIDRLERGLGVAGRGVDDAQGAVDKYSRMGRRVVGNLPDAQGAERIFREKTGIDAKKVDAQFHRWMAKEKDLDRILRKAESRIEKEIRKHEKIINEVEKRYDKIKNSRLMTLKEIQNIEIKSADVMKGLNNASNALQFLAKKRKEFVVPAKAVMIAQAVATTYLKAVQQLGKPWPINLIAMAATIAGGMLSVNQIRKQKFELGGRVNGPSHSEGGVWAELEGGEHVWSRRDVKAAGGHRAVEAIKDRSPGNGSFTGVRLAGLRRFATEESGRPFYRAQGAN